ncbi:16S rRNA (cytidine(1402)-2'-O)-methyltransferase [Pelagovum sp. HNIBRBA483]|uniref:16S rRNA (cytidine(1402)-2'-O)-methyltransferase n=1 Tax=Pelagovum sp. HNIBRBA483 TaxID=3233341 RepID=UPI0034A27956
MKIETKPLSPGLYLVSTPIGSARDITLRALDVLASADLIAAEDTRTARKLMEIHGLPLAGRPVMAHHDHSGDTGVQGLIALMREGKSLAYVSEAGTPMIADPGFELGRAAIAEGLSVTAVPGASAAVTALTVSGLPTDRFHFVGFLPASNAQRESELAELRNVAATLVFYESPKRVDEMLRCAAEILGGNRPAAICRELTKKFEEVRRGTLETLVADLDNLKHKGEFVVLVGRAEEETVSEADVTTALEEALLTMRVKDAATAVAGAMGLPRRQVYQVALSLSKKQ